MSNDWLKRFWVRRGDGPGEGAVGAYQSGSSNFASPHVDVSIDNVGSTSYHVTIQPSENPGGNLGEVYYERTSSTSFRVFNTGTATTSFNWELRSVEIAGFTYHGVANFKAAGTYTLVTGFNMGTNPYNISITPLGDPGGNAGEIWYDDVTGTSFRVYNSGSATTQFTWSLSKRV